MPHKLTTSSPVVFQKQTSLQILLAGLCSGLAISAVVTLSQFANQPLLLGSFGGSCFLLFGFPRAVFSQPRNLIIGHILCSLIGLIFLKYLGSEWWSMGLAVTTAVVLMLASQTLHPPAVSNAIIVFLTPSDWQFLWYPTIAGIALLLVLSRILLRLTTKVAI